VPVRHPTRGLLALISLLAVLAAGCGGSSSEDGSAAAPATTAAPTTTTTPPTTEAPTSQPSGAASCDDATLLRAARDAVGDLGGAATITRVTVIRCRNGYALVRAHPDAANLESPNVFLVWREAAGSWEAVDVGTGIDCAGSPVGPELTQACRALGYPG
jgi:hypothetical protein